MQHKDALRSELRVSACLLQGRAVSARLLTLYSDADGALQETVSSVSGRGEESLTATFYARLAEAQEARRGGGSAPAAANVPPAGASDPLLTVVDVAADTALSSFAPEELYGKYVDMMPLFEEWVNLPGIKECRGAGATVTTDGSKDGAEALARVDYIAFLRSFSDLHTAPALPRRTLTSRHFRGYLTRTATYLINFFAATHPLVPARDVLTALTDEWESRWRAGAADAWAAEVWVPQASAQGVAGGDGDAADGTASGAGAAASVVDVSSFESAAALLEGLGGDRGVRAQLRLRGLKSGGAPAEAAERLWTVRAIGAAGPFPKKLIAVQPPPPPPQQQQQQRTAQRPAGTPLSESSRANAAVALIDDIVTWGSEALISRGFSSASATSGSTSSPPPLVAWLRDITVRLAGDVLAEVITASRRRVEKRLLRTAAENTAAREAEEAEVAGGMGGDEGDNAVAAAVAVDDDDDDAPIYNPKNVPLGADGKPMPYWLWKLQGLNIGYECEICGGDTIMGRRNFDRHFQDARHAAGMRALGIPNTKHFHDVTRIADALALHARLQVQLAAETFAAASEEEFEDSVGNVVPRRTYEDLARAGML